MFGAVRLLNFIARHPLNRREPLRAMGRVLAWQIATRLRTDAVAVPFVERTRLLVRRGMTGATGNVYCGLHEFEDMAFVLHALRREDVFVDVGANIGSYAVLAAGVAGARCIAFEPGPRAYSALLDNLRLNDLLHLVDARNEGVGATPGELAFTANFDTMNHVVAQAEADAASVRVPITTLDTALAAVAATMIKIDVEGYETAVIAGADRVLGSPSVRVVLMELNGSGARYGFDEQRLHERMLQYGFITAHYDPALRELRTRERARVGGGNLLYIRNLQALQARVSSAPRWAVHGTSI